MNKIVKVFEVYFVQFFVGAAMLCYSTKTPVLSSFIYVLKRFHPIFLTRF